MVVYTEFKSALMDSRGPQKHSFIAVEILFLSFVQAEIPSGLEAAISIFYFRSGQTAFPISRLDTVFKYLSNVVSYA